MSKIESIKKGIANAFTLSFPWKKFPNGSEMLAQKFRNKLSFFSEVPGFVSIREFFQEIDKDLLTQKTIARPIQSETVDRFCLGGKEVVSFFKDNFPIIKNSEAFLSMLQTFGLQRGRFNNGLFSEALVYSLKDKPGGFIYFQPTKISSIQESPFCLMCQRGLDGNEILDISGIGSNESRFITARYIFSPKNNAFVRTELDMEVSAKELRSFNIGHTPVKYYDFEPHLLITEKMKKSISDVSFIAHFGKRPFPQNLLSGVKQIPQMIS